MRTIPDVKKTIITFYMLEALFMLSVNTIHATNILFMLSKGLDLLQVNLVNIFYMGSVFLLEIPTGAISDMFGRKRSFLIACFSISVSFTIYYLSGSFWYFALAEMVAAVGMTFHSGALEAWFVDSLDVEGYTEKKDKLFGRAGTLTSGASIVAGLLGAYLGSVYLALPFLAGAAFAFVTMLIAFGLLEEVHHAPEQLSWESGMSRMKEIINFSIVYGVKNRVVLLLIVPGAISMFSYMALMQYWQPYFKELANTQELGYVWVGLSAGLMIGSFLVQWTQVLKRYTVLIFSTLVCALTLLGMTQSSYFLISLTLFLSYFVGRGIMLATRKAYINDHIPAETRATVLSFDSMICRGAAALGLVFFGVIAKSTSIIGSWYAAVVVMVVAAVPLVFLRTAKHSSSH